MELLVTLIGNAAMDPFFRKHLLDDPVQIVDAYGFRLTKGDFEMMTAMFAKLEETDKAHLNQAFQTLENLLYRKVEAIPHITCPRPCRPSLFPPPELRQEREAAKKTAA